MSYNPYVKHCRDAGPALSPRPEADQTLAALLRGPATAPALHVPDGLRLDFGGLAEAVGEMAGVLRAAGVTRGDRVVLVVPDGPVLLQTLLAVVTLGAAAAPLNPAYTHDEYVFFMEDLDPRLALLSADEATAARAASSVGVGVGELLVEDGRPRGVQVDGRDVRTAQDFEPAQPDDVALLLHTSGTTSRPKQVPLSHRNLMASARAIAAHYRLGSEDVSFVRDAAVPRAWSRGLRCSPRCSAAAGWSSRLASRRSACCDQLEPAGVTWFSAGPTLHQMVLERLERTGRTAPRGLRFLRSCSSALSPGAHGSGRGPLRGAAARGLRHDRGEPSDRLEPAAAAGAAGLHGRRRRPARRSASSTRRAPSCRWATQVRWLIRGPGAHDRLPRQPRGQRRGVRRRLVPHRRPGLGRRGRLPARSSGRLKEMILRGGENISPDEIEDVLRAHPAVVDAACFGVPDEKYGELVGAAVSLNADADADALTAHCRERLAAFKVPSVIHILDAVPRTATGKLQRRRIAARFVEALMRFAVVGAGAIGAYVGAALARGGADVTLIARGAHLRAHAGARRARAQPARRLRRAPRRRRTTSTRSPTPTWSSSALKAHSLPELRRGIGAALAPGAAVIAAQNGMPVVVLPVSSGPARGPVLESVDPGGGSRRRSMPARVIGCVIYCSTEIVEPGVSATSRERASRSASRTASGASAALRISEAFKAGGLKCPVETDLREQIWLKLIGNVAFNPVSALTGATLGELGSRAGDGRRPARDARGVRGRSPTALGIELPVSIERRLEAGFAVGDHKTSMLQDLEAGQAARDRLPERRGGGARRPLRAPRPDHQGAARVHGPPRRTARSSALFSLTPARTIRGAVSPR